MEIRLFGAAKTVTGSCYSLITDKDKILIDCGMFQGNKETSKQNYDKFGFDPKDYKNLLLTHAHLDHCGRIPKLVKEGFKGKIFTTAATRDLAIVVMMDSAHIALQDTIYKNKKREREGLPPREPMYTEDDVKTTVKLFQKVDYDKEVNITDNITAKFYDAGHILGAASIQLKIKEDEKETTVVFSGDIGQYGNPIVKDPEVIEKADYVFIESTYGDRLHSPIKEGKTKFLDVINETYEKGGSLMIPSFAIERTQELLYNLNEFVEKGLIPRMDIYLDSPMAIKATEVFKKHPECYDEDLKTLIRNNDNPFTFPGFKYSMTVDDSKKINETKKPHIVIAGSGMCTGGRIKHHLKHKIDDPKNTLLFVGYQSIGTLGYWIQQGEKNIKLLGTRVPVNAKIESIDSFSGHSDYEGLLAWIRYIKPIPKKAFIVHGEEKSCISFSKKVEKLGIKTYIPSMGESIVL